ncbi:hypothetical protein Moror_3972 [Moniliophthora roreri MCA 2997]|uniref:Uncharacterized protein n=1 Tax=Moniliophthora roreri (strain MCA 2997) TaxID=1381753 RepID=V2YU87_MONRO|nr:hypothetical protein Moror_3972 [Moniliophthora roreri MCA 2997]
MSDCRIWHRAAARREDALRHLKYSASKKSQYVPHTSRAPPIPRPHRHDGLLDGLLSLAVASRVAFIIATMKMFEMLFLAISHIPNDKGASDIERRDLVF